MKPKKCFVILLLLALAGRTASGASLSDEITAYNAKVVHIIQLIQSNDNSGARAEADELRALDSTLTKALNYSTKRFLAIADSAFKNIPGFDAAYKNLYADYYSEFASKAVFHVGLTNWFLDTTVLSYRDTLSTFANSVVAANNQVLSSIQAMDALTQNINVPVKVFITDINGPEEIGNGSINSFSIFYENFGTESADDVYIALKPGGGFALSPDSIYIGSIGSGDIGQVTIQVTAPATDTFFVFPIALGVGNGPGDFNSYLLVSSELNDEPCDSLFFADNDADGYGNAADSIRLCSREAGFVTDSTDCVDTLASIHPGAAELCNGIDDDCDGQIDEGVLLTFYRNYDGDGYGDPTDSVRGCSVPDGYVTDNTDCDDSLASSYPGAPELCNGIDENCDGQIDEGVLISFFRDIDGDGYGNIAVSLQACLRPEGYIEDSTDCDDTRADVRSGMPELCNVIDDNCNGHIDEGCGSNTYYADSDGDDFGNHDRTISTNDASPPSGYVTDNTDCDDSNQSVNTNGTETCNSIDDNCNGSVDEGFLLTFYRDADGDGFGNAALTTLACSAPSGYVSDNTDCSDGNAAVHPSATEIVCNGLDDNCNTQTDELQFTFYRDADGDGFGNVNVTTQACAAPSGYVADSTDCNDGNAAAYPSATEVCNVIDDNCNGTIDEGVQLTFYRDADGDGFGNSSATTLACSAPLGYVNDTTDCDDNNAAVYPGATEVCNSIDNNCNGEIDENVKSTFYRDADGDGFGDVSVATQACSAPSGYVADSTDCNDANAAVNPVASEVCNSTDDNCNGEFDENVKTTFYRDGDGDGFGNVGVFTRACSVPAGYVADTTDCDDGKASVKPVATEVCDSIDNDCDGQIDENVKSTFYRDADGDGFGNVSITTLACSFPIGFVTDNTDCDDGRASVYPGGAEVCNGADDDCDGQADENTKSFFYRDADGDGFGNPGITIHACSPPPGFAVNPADCDDGNASVHSGACCLSNTDCNDNIPCTLDSCISSICVSPVNPSGIGTVFVHPDTDGDGSGDSNPDNAIGCPPPMGARVFYSGYFILSNSDCDDNSATVSPGVTEICNGIDDNCNGVRDEGCPHSYFADADGDGFGDPNTFITLNNPVTPAGYVTDNTDCDDTDADVHP